MAATRRKFPEKPEAIYQAYSQRYSPLKRSCERRVVTWRWASKLMFDPRPFGVLLEGPGRWLRTKLGVTPFEYGMDAEGRVLVERTHMGHHYREQFFGFKTRRRATELEPWRFSFRHPVLDAPGCTRKSAPASEARASSRPHSPWRLS